LGGGQVECTKTDGTCQLPQTNRDVNAAQTFDMHIDIKPIFAYYSSLRPSDLDLPKNPREFLERTIDKLAEGFGFSKSDTATLEETKKKLEEQAAAAEKEYQALPAEQKAKADEYVESQRRIVKESKQELRTIKREVDTNRRSEESAVADTLRVVAERIRILGDGYLDFATKHPIAAQYGLSALNIVVQTAIAGIPGLINSVKTEAVGFTIGEAVGDKVGEFIRDKIDRTAIIIQNNIRGLTEIDAKSLAAGAILGAVIVAAGTLGVKTLCKDLKRFTQIHALATPNGMPMSGFAFMDDVGTKAAEGVKKAGSGVGTKVGAKGDKRCPFRGRNKEYQTTIILTGGRQL